MLYGAAVWDPILIIAQIVSVQCLFYLSLGLLHLLFLGRELGVLSIAHIFGWRHLSFKTKTGWLLLISNLCNAPIGALYLVWIVERAKKCLDFASTAYILHLIACSIFDGFPISLPWWTVNTLGMLIMSLLGEWLCVRRELADIPIGSLRSRASQGGLPGSSAGGAGSGRAAGSTAGASGAAAVQMTATSAGQGGATLVRASSTTRLLGGDDEV